MELESLRGVPGATREVATGGRQGRGDEVAIDPEEREEGCHQHLANPPEPFKAVTAATRTRGFERPRVAPLRATLSREAVGCFA